MSKSDLDNNFKYKVSSAWTLERIRKLLANICIVYTLR